MSETRYLKETEVYVDPDTGETLYDDGEDYVCPNCGETVKEADIIIDNDDKPIGCSLAGCLGDYN